MKRWLLLSCVVALPVLACAGDPIAPPFDGESLEEATWLARDPTSVLRLGEIDVVLEKTTLREAMAAVGAGRIDQSGDAGDSVHWVCYTWQAGGQRLWLSSGELSGGEVIDTITAIGFAGTAMETNACPELPAKATPVRLASGPWLGATASELQAAFGGAAPGDHGSYAYQAKSGEFDVLAHFAFRLVDGKATSVRMERVTSN
jgi:hypothetical protein